MFVARTLGGRAKPHMNDSYRALNVACAEVLRRCLMRLFGELRICRSLL